MTGIGAKPSTLGSPAEVRLVILWQPIIAPVRTTPHALLLTPLDPPADGSVGWIADLRVYDGAIEPIDRTKGANLRDREPRAGAF
jgi:hypothetical protein